MTYKDSILVLAWPDTWVTQTGAWYDPLMHWIGIAKNKKYRVGHAALALINHQTGDVHYFDFGRYIAPKGFGRIRDEQTDPSIIVHTKAQIESDNTISNLDEILLELYHNKETHGKGKLVASCYSKINFKEAYTHIKNWQTKGAVPYGPFTQKGTNCSRFVASTLKKGSNSFLLKFLLSLPYTVSPSPKSNIRIANTKRNYYVVSNNEVKMFKTSITKRIA